MPDNASGVYSLPPGPRPTAGQTALASQVTTPLDDIAAALTNRLHRDGRAPMIGDLTLYRNATDPLHAVTKQQLDTKADDPGYPIASATVLKNRVYTVDDATGASDGAKIVAAAAYAAANTGELWFDRTYTVTGDLQLPGGVHYRAKPGIGKIDGSARTDTLANDYLRGTLKVQGSRGSPVTLSADIGGGMGVTPLSITAAAGVATVTTYGNHGLQNGGLGWLLFMGSYPQLPAGGLYFACQSQSTEQMPLTVPHTITVTGAKTFTFPVDPAAPASMSVGSWHVRPNDNVIRTGAAHGLVAGDAVEISSDKLVPQISGAQAVRYGEMARVTRVISSTVAVLDRPLKYSYAVADNAVVRKLSLEKRVLFSDLEIIGRGSTEAASYDFGDTGLSVDLVQSFELNRVFTKDMAWFGVTMHRFEHGVCNSIRDEAILSDDAGRITGIMKEKYSHVWGGWFGSLVMNSPVAIGNARHHLTEATHGGVNMPGISGALEVNNPYYVGSTSNCIATHYPNDGFRVRGGFVSGDEYGLDARGGNLDVDGLRGYGGRGLINAYGFLNSTRINNVSGENYSGTAIFVNQYDGALYTQPTIRISDARLKNVSRGIFVNSSNTTYELDCVVAGAGIDGCELEPVRINGNATALGKASVSGVWARRSNYSTSLIPVVLSNLNSVSLENIKGVPEPGQTNYGYSVSNVTGLRLGENVDVATNATLMTISGGVLDVSVRADDFTIAVRGEGNVADNLDKIVGLRAGQRITLLRYSEVITVRDGSVSGILSNQGAIQTEANASLVLDDAYDSIVIEGLTTSTGPVYARVVTVVQSS